MVQSQQKYGTSRHERLSAEAVERLFTVTLVMLQTGWFGLLGYGLWTLITG